MDSNRRWDFLLAPCVSSELLKKNVNESHVERIKMENKGNLFETVKIKKNINNKEFDEKRVVMVILVEFIIIEKFIKAI